mmetsp:Transcript_77113/g.223129  ORF Transcript_77113/g.223129 Transcript_77113/m.223129 type:complete len:602 (+) Transcript_77113:111-1916(+)
MAGLNPKETSVRFRETGSLYDDRTGRDVFTVQASTLPVPMSPMQRPSSVDSKTSAGMGRRASRISSVALMSDCINAMDEMTANSAVFADRFAFCSVLALEVTVSLVCIGLEVDGRCRTNCTDADLQPWKTMNYVLTALAIVDILVSMASYGPKRYFRGEPHEGKFLAWPRFFDFLIVLLRVVDVFIIEAALGHYTGLKFFVALRAVHLFNFANKIKMIPVFRDLWWIMSGIAGTLRSVVIVITILVLAAYLFAIIVTLQTGKRIVPNDHYQFDMSDWDKDAYFGSVHNSMFSLLQIATRDRWSMSLVRPILEKHPGMVVWFVTFLIFGNTAAMSTIVGVIVEHTLSSAKANTEKRRRETEKLEMLVMRSLEEVFMDVGADDDNEEITRQALHRALKQQNVLPRLDIVGIKVCDLDLLFSLLDVDHKGSVKAGAFFRGCMRIRGPALARDLNSLAVDMKRQITWLDDNEKKMDNINESMAKILDLLDGVDCNVIIGNDDSMDPVMKARRDRPAARKVNWHKPDAADCTSLASVGRTASVRPGSSKQKSKSILKTALLYKENLYEEAAHRHRGQTPLTMVAKKSGHTVGPPPPPPMPPHLDKQ